MTKLSLGWVFFFLSFLLMSISERFVSPSLTFPRGLTSERFPGTCVPSAVTAEETCVHWQEQCTSNKMHGASFVWLVPLGKSCCSSTLGALPKMGKLAATHSSADWQAASSCLNQPGWLLAGQVGFCWGTGVCCMIETCKVIPLMLLRE